MLKTKEEIEKEFDGKFIRDGLFIPGKYDGNLVLDFINQIRADDEKAIREEDMKVLIKIFDDLEIKDPDTSTENWKNYKFIRNNIRDYYKNKLIC